MKHSRGAFGSARGPSKSGGGDFVAHTSAGVLGNLVAAGLALAYVLAVARLLGPAEYAVVAASLSVAYLVSLVVNPLETSISKMSAVLHGRQDARGLAAVGQRSLKHNATRGVAMALAWLPIGFMLSRWLHWTAVAVDLAWRPLGLSFPTAVVRGWLRGVRRFAAYSLNQVIESAGRLAIGIAAVSAGLGASGAVFGYVAGLGIALIAGLRQLQPWRGASTEATAEDLEFVSYPIYLGHFYLAFVVNADVIAAKHYLTDSEVGQYGAAASLARVIYLAATPVYQVLLTHISARHSRQEPTARLTVSVLAGMSLALLVGFGVVLLIGARSMDGTFGRAYGGGAAVLPIVWASTSLLVVEAAAFQVLIGVNRLRAAWMFLLPCAGFVAAVATFHGTPTAIATSGLVSVTGGLLVLIVMAALQPARHP